MTARIDAAMAPFHALRELLTSIPGVSTRVADVIIAETGGDMSRFPTAGHLASWAGVCPGHHESAGRTKSSKTRPGDRYLKGALGIAALSIARTQGTFLNAKYRRLAKRLGNLQALVAIEHTILVTVWNMITTGAYYTEAGPDYYLRHHPERTERNAIRNFGHSATRSPSNGLPDLPLGELRVRRAVYLATRCRLAASNNASINNIPGGIRKNPQT